ncbi:carboxypeptidase-like regulatory domain-containing protein [bacterium]|nr:carboxypeptidase-like regulatory domain-containing protein [bacterium]
MIRAWLIAIVSFSLAGCGASDPLQRQQVSGEVSLKGTPIAEGTIEFSPVGEGTASGAMIEAGKFTIPANKGLPPGEYIVRISASNSDAEQVEMPGESNKIAEELIPPEYNVESDVKFTVSLEGENIFTLDIES